ncbi:MAG: hypothetical protein GY854_30070 [Deltaproteobacteria bacterium]|nr:hypothetical protein [Deltaproteobacteria bacterium]
MLRKTHQRIVLLLTLGLGLFFNSKLDARSLEAGIEDLSSKISNVVSMRYRGVTQRVTVTHFIFENYAGERLESDRLPSPSFMRDLENSLGRHARNLGYEVREKNVDVEIIKQDLCKFGILTPQTLQILSKITDYAIIGFFSGWNSEEGYSINAKVVDTHEGVIIGGDLSTVIYTPPKICFEISEDTLKWRFSEANPGPRKRFIADTIRKFNQALVDFDLSNAYDNSVEATISETQSEDIKVILETALNSDTFRETLSAVQTSVAKDASERLSDVINHIATRDLNCVASLFERDYGKQFRDSFYFDIELAIGSKKRDALGFVDVNLIQEAGAVPVDHTDVALAVPIAAIALSSLSADIASRSSSRMKRMKSYKPRGRSPKVRGPKIGGFFRFLGWFGLAITVIDLLFPEDSNGAPDPAFLGLIRAELLEAEIKNSIFQNIEQRIEEGVAARYDAEFSKAKQTLLMDFTLFRQRIRPVRDVALENREFLYFLRGLNGAQITRMATIGQRCRKGEILSLFEESSLEEILIIPTWQFQLILRMIEEGESLATSFRWLQLAQTAFRRVVTDRVHEFIDINEVDPSVARKLLKIHDSDHLRKFANLADPVKGNIVLLSDYDLRSLGGYEAASVSFILDTIGYLSSDNIHLYIHSVVVNPGNIKFFFSVREDLELMSPSGQLEIIAFAGHDRGMISRIWAIMKSENKKVLSSYFFRVHGPLLRTYIVILIIGAAGFYGLKLYRKKMAFRNRF